MKRVALYHLETLHWIDQLGSFRGAAERLNTTQPAISARVREVEEQLGVTLFQRQGRRMVLNARGRRLVDACEPLRADLERTLLDIGNFAGASGIVRIQTGEIAAASCLPAFIHQIERDLPGIVMELEVDLTARMISQLLGGTTDLAFLAGPVTIPGLRTAPIGSVALVWAAGRSSAESSAWPAGPVWSLPSHSPIHAVTRETLARHGLPSRSIHTCTNVRTLIDIVTGGGGTAVLPETMIQRELASGALVEVRPRPERRLHFEVAVRTAERDPVLLELFARASHLAIEAADAPRPRLG